MSNDNDDDSEITALAIDSAGFDAMSEPLILTQIINPVMP